MITPSRNQSKRFKFLLNLYLNLYFLTYFQWDYIKILCNHSKQRDMAWEYLWNPDFEIHAILIRTLLLYIPRLVLFTFGDYPLSLSVIKQIFSGFLSVISLRKLINTVLKNYPNCDLKTRIVVNNIAGSACHRDRNPNLSVPERICYNW